MSAASPPTATIQRARILDAMVDVVAERGFAGASVGLVIARAKVSPHTFYDLFGGLNDCFLAVIDQETQRAAGLVTRAFQRESVWLDGLRSALTSLLTFLDSEPLLARVWLVEVLAAGTWALERRARNLSALTGLIVSAWELPDGWQPPPLAAEGVMTSILGVLHNHLVARSPQPLTSLLGPLMGIVTRPYLSPEHVTREITWAETLAAEIMAGRACPSPDSADAPIRIPEFVAHPRAHRARGCLHYVARHPDSSNRQIAVGIGLGHRGQASTLLARLAAVGLLQKRPGAAGHPNAWRVTSAGEQVVTVLDEKLKLGEHACLPLTMTNTERAG